MIPSYLQEISDVKFEDDNHSKLCIRCTCGFDKFLLFVKRKTKEDIQVEKDLEKRFRKEWGNRVEMQSNSDGEVFLVRKNIFGKVTKKRKFSEICAKTYKEYICIKCAFCEREYVLFDERIHGFDGCLNHDCVSALDQIHYSNDTFKLNIDLNYNIEIFEDDTLTDKSIAFDRIQIYKTNGSKKVKILDCECG